MKTYIIVYSKNTIGTSHKCIEAENKNDAKEKFMLNLPKDYKKIIKIIL